MLKRNRSTPKSASTAADPNPTKTVTTKRRVLEARELWLEFFTDALDTLTPSAFADDESDTTARNEIGHDEADRITRQASCIADSALERYEERWRGV